MKIPNADLAFAAKELLRAHRAILKVLKLPRKAGRARRCRRGFAMTYVPVEAMNSQSVYFVAREFVREREFKAREERSVFAGLPKKYNRRARRKR